MKKISLLLAFVLPTAVAVAAPAHSTKPVAIQAEVVATDATAEKLTYKTAAGDEKTAAVAKEAAASLKTLKAGDKVTLSVKDEGDAETVLSVHKATAKSHKKTTSKTAASTKKQ